MPFAQPINAGNSSTKGIKRCLASGRPHNKIFWVTLKKHRAEYEVTCDKVTYFGVKKNRRVCKASGQIDSHNTDPGRRDECPARSGQAYDGPDFSA